MGNKTRAVASSAVRPFSLQSFVGKDLEGECFETQGVPESLPPQVPLCVLSSLSNSSLKPERRRPSMVNTTDKEQGTWNKEHGTVHKQHCRRNTPGQGCCKYPVAGSRDKLGSWVNENLEAE